MKTIFLTNGVIDSDVQSRRFTVWHRSPDGLFKHLTLESEQHLSTA
jgi:hypothetical protein